MSFRPVASLCFLAFLAVELVAAVAGAHPFRVNEIPNGKVKQCLNCHMTLKGENFTEFGSDVKFTLTGDVPVGEKHVDWHAVYAKDSDDDTYANGLELGDPDGTWVIGDPDPSSAVYNPGDNTSYPLPTCGSGVLEFGEECEGSQLADPDCVALGYDGGTLACTQVCRYDVSGCSGVLPDAGPGGVPSGFPKEESGCTFAPSDSSGAARSLGLLALLACARAVRRRRFA